MDQIDTIEKLETKLKYGVKVRDQIYTIKRLVIKLKYSIQDKDQIRSLPLIQLLLFIW